MLSSPYETNLGTTAVLARLAHLPHPHLHEWLLNPLLPLAPNTRSLYTCLKQVLAAAVIKAEVVEHFPRKMMGCRKMLLGSGGVRGPDDQLSPEELILLEAILVIDEFCKELAAISFVKYHAFSS